MVLPQTSATSRSAMLQVDVMEQSPRPQIEVTQAEFDATVQENVEIFGMDIAEASESAAVAFQMQGADLSGVNTGPPSEGTRGAEHPAISGTVGLRHAVSAFESIYKQAEVLNGTLGEIPFERDGNKGSGGLEHEEGASGRSAQNGSDAVSETRHLKEPGSMQQVEGALGNLVAAVERLEAVCKEGEEGAVVAGKEGAVELAATICGLVQATDRSVAFEKSLCLLEVLLTGGDANRARFWEASAAATVTASARSFCGHPGVVHHAGRVAAAASARFELLKEAFMDAEAHLLLVAALQDCSSRSEVDAVKGACLGLMAFATNDDPRVAASNAFANARKIAEAGCPEACLKAAAMDAFRRRPDALLTLLNTLRTIAATDEICKSIAAGGGIDMSLHLLQSATSDADVAVAQSACAFLGRLAASDENKAAVAAAGGIESVVAAASSLGSGPAVIQECFATLAALTLRMPENAARAADAGAADVAAEAMDAHPSAAGLQRQACILIRNLAVRNPENRALLLEKGLESRIRRAKERHKQCRDVGSAALRDLGLADYK